MGLMLEFVCDDCGKKEMVKPAKELIVEDLFLAPDGWFVVWADSMEKAYCLNCREHPFEKVLREAFGMGPNDTEGKLGDWSAKIVEKKIMPAKKIPDEKAG